MTSEYMKALDWVLSLSHKNEEIDTEIQRVLIEALNRCISLDAIAKKDAEYREKHFG